MLTATQVKALLPAINEMLQKRGRKPYVPVEKLKSSQVKNIRKYVCPECRPEELIAFRDITLFRSCKYGYLLTTRGLHVGSLAQEGEQDVVWIPLEDIKEVVSYRSGNNLLNIGVDVVYTNGRKLTVKFVGGDIDVEAVCVAAMNAYGPSDRNYNPITPQQLQQAARMANAYIEQNLEDDGTGKTFFYPLQDWTQYSFRTELDEFAEKLQPETLVLAYVGRRDINDRVTTHGIYSTRFGRDSNGREHVIVFDGLRDAYIHPFRMGKLYLVYDSGTVEFSCGSDEREFCALLQYIIFLKEGRTAQKLPPEVRAALLEDAEEDWAWRLLEWGRSFKNHRLFAPGYELFTESYRKESSELLQQAVDAWEYGADAGCVYADFARLWSLTWRGVDRTNLYAALAAVNREEIEPTMFAMAYMRQHGIDCRQSPEAALLAYWWSYRRGFTDGGFYAAQMLLRQPCCSFVEETVAWEMFLKAAEGGHREAALTAAKLFARGETPPIAWELIYQHLMTLMNGNRQWDRDHKRDVLETLLRCFLYRPELQYDERDLQYCAFIGRLYGADNELLLAAEKLLH